MNQKTARNYGRQVGYDIASTNRADYNLASEDEREKFISDMVETEQEHFRQYSPFEFFASNINKTGNRADRLWQEYDSGVIEGIEKLVKEEVNLIKNNHE